MGAGLVLAARVILFARLFPLFLHFDDVLLLRLGEALITPGTRCPGCDRWARFRCMSPQPRSSIHANSRFKKKTSSTMPAKNMILAGQIPSKVSVFHM